MREEVIQKLRVLLAGLDNDEYELALYDIIDLCEKKLDTINIDDDSFSN